MTGLIKKLNDYINNLSLREKLLLLGVIIAAIYSIWDLLFFSPYIAHQKQLTSEQQVQIDKQTAIAEEIAQITIKLQNSEDPNQKLRQQIAEVKRQTQQINQQLDEKLDKLVPPTQITSLVKNLLIESKGLRLLSLKNEPVEVIELLPKDQRDNEAYDAEEHAKLYKHTSTITVLGDFQALQRYLAALESSEWGLYWDQLSYEVKQYPTAEISLSVHTVSKNAHWIGL